MKHQPVENMQISDAITNIKAINTYIKNCAKEIKAEVAITETLKGPQGAVSHQSALSVEMIEKELRRLRTLLHNLNPEYNTYLHTCLTVKVENLHPKPFLVPISDNVDISQKSSQYS